MAPLLVIVILLAASGPAARRAEAGFYTVADLGNLGSGSPTITGTGLNASGAVTGYYNGGGGTRDFVANGGTMTSIPGFGGTYSFGGGINSAGTVVGYSYTSGNASADAFSYSNGAMTDLTATQHLTLGGTTAAANGINDKGQIVGYAATADGSTHAFLFSGGTTTDLGTLAGAGNSHANAINFAGQITGNSDDADGISHAFLYTAGVMKDLGTVGGATGASTGNDLNASGQVVGYSATPGGSLHAFLYDGTTMTDLTSAAAYDGFISQAVGINTAGQVVGYYGSTSFSSHGFLYNGGVLTDLNSLISPGSGWTITGAYSINDSGQIAAIGTNGQGQSHALLLSGPTLAVPEPPTLALICTGALLGLGMRKATRRELASALAAESPTEA